MLSILRQPADYQRLANKAQRALEAINDLGTIDLGDEGLGIVSAMRTNALALLGAAKVTEAECQRVPR